MFGTVGFFTIVKARCSPFDTCIVYFPSMFLNKVTKPFAEFSERPSYHPQVDLGQERTVYGVAVQGYHSSAYYISSFKLSHSVNGNMFVYAKNKGSDVSIRKPFMYCSKIT